jgi:hypothetical protein
VNSAIMRDLTDDRSEEHSREQAAEALAQTEVLFEHVELDVN